MLAVEAGASETIANKEKKERRARWFLEFCLLLSRYRRFCLLSAVGCVEDAKNTEEKRGGGKGLEYVGVFFLFSKCVRACVRAIVCMFSFSKILLNFFPLIYIE
jgi:hypothetical protein